MIIQTQKNLSGLRVIRALTYRFSANERNQIIRSEYPTVLASDIQEAVFNKPTSSHVVVNSADKVRVFISGIKGKQGATNVALGYAGGSPIPTEPGFNSWLGSDARTIWYFWFREQFRGYKRVEIHGHSAGGVVAEALAKLLSRLYRGVPIDVHTYGSPAPGVSGICVNGEQYTRERWMNQDDAVPLVPWCRLGPNEFMGLYLFGLLSGVPSSQVATPHRFVQPGSGIRMESGRVTSGDNPRISSDPQRQVSLWMEGEEGAVEAHSVDSYFRKMTTYTRDFPAGIRLAPVAEVSEPAADVNVVAVAPFAIPGQVVDSLPVPIRIRADATAVDPQNQAVGTATISEVPMSFLRINPRKAFKLAKVGRTWQVTMGEAVVMVADTPKVPRTIVKRLNGMLRGIGTDNTVRLDAFIAALQNWMTNAASDVTYCKPPMRVDL